MDNRRPPGQDLLSDLPMSILEIILMFMSIRDAVKTSILSSKWRYRWTRLPQLVFHGEHLIPHANDAVGDAKREKRLKKFVNHTLFLQEGPIHRFELVDNRMDSCHVTDQWLRFLYRRDIKELKLDIRPREAPCFYLPSSLYSFQSLTLLELVGCQFGSPPPTVKGFLCLRSLILENIDAFDDTIESLIANSPRLERFTYDSAVSWELRIGAPNLRYLNLTGFFNEMHVDAPLLAEMDFRWDETFFNSEQHQEKRSVSNYSKLLAGFTNLERLTGSGNFTKYLSIGIQYCKHPLAFQHLKVITLERVNLEDIDELFVVVWLIMDAAASLCKLEVEVDYEKQYVSTAPQIHFWDSELLRNCPLQKLKVIKMANFHGGVHEMKFLSFLLESSPVLETMIVQPTLYGTYQQEPLHSILELLSYSKASTNAEILFKQI